EDFRRDDESVAVLRQQVPVVTEFGFLPTAFARQKGVWIGGGFMCLVTALLPMEVHRRVTRILRWRILLILPLKTLQARPGLDQRAVYRKMLVACQVLVTCLFDHFIQKLARHVAFQ